MSAAAPSATAADMPTRPPSAQSIIAAHSAPDCVTSASPPGCGRATAKVAFRPTCGRTTPKLFGPSRRTPPSRAMRSTRACRSRPLSSLSAKPPLSTAAAGMRARTQSPTTCSTASAGTAITARSTGRGSACSEGKQGRPDSSARRGLTANTSPA
uniref:Uncharacterized protein n=1 Tax=Mizugakiibacter sediminis TaxID=1475481 RepID=A0A0S6YYH0_9GAMM